jgi:hypothetical protein
VMNDVGVSSEVLAALSLNDVTLCRVAQAAEIDADAFAVRQRIANVNREAINPDQAVTVDVVRKTIRVPEDAVYVPAGQPRGSLAALALEPDSPGSLIGAGLVAPLAGTDELPVYRLYAAPKLARMGLGDPAVCSR